MKTLAMIDLTDVQSIQGYEDLLRKRLNRLGYGLSKRKTIQPGPHFIELKKTPKPKGFKITDVASGSTVAGENYDLSLEEVERFWSKEYEKWCIEQRERKRQKDQERAAIKTRPKTVCVDGRWTVTNDKYAISALKNHITQYGDFDAGGHGAGGDIANMMYLVYRPWCCPEFERVWPIDGDWSNLTDLNLRSDADETALPDGVIPITTQRRIWHNEHRIFLKLPIRDQLFFTDYSPERFQILCSKALSGWYVQGQIRNTKTAYRLYCRMAGGAASLAEIVALHDAGKIDINDLVGSILNGKKWLRDNDLQVDHLKDNTQNNCAHKLCIVKSRMNGGKSDIVTEIMLPYVFLPVRVGNTFRVLCGRAKHHADTNDYDLTTLKMIVCQGVNEFFEFVREFKKAAETNGDMSERPNDHSLTNCAVQMFADDGQEYHDNIYNPIEMLLRAGEDEFESWNGDCLWLDT